MQILSGSIWQQSKLRQIRLSDAILGGALFDSAVVLEGDTTIAELKKSGATVERLGVVRDRARPEPSAVPSAKSQGPIDALPTP